MNLLDTMDRFGTLVSLGTKDYLNPMVLIIISVNPFGPILQLKFLVSNYLAGSGSIPHNCESNSSEAASTVINDS